MPDETPSLLYHYTTQEGLLGIVEKRCLWATDIKFLNDASEYKYPIELVGSVLGERLKNAEGALKDFWGILLSKVRVLEQPGLYVTCFCEDGDLLSQWRGYGGATTGYAIGFDKERLQGLARSQGFELSRCEYQATTQRTLIGEIITEVYNDFRTQGYHPEHEFPFSGQMVKEFYVPLLGHKLLALAPRIKHPSFSEEREWRLHHPGSQDSQQGMRAYPDAFRLGRSMPIPHKTIRLGDSGRDLPIKHIVVSPNATEDLTERAVREFTNHHEVPCRVTTSQIQYRPGL
jgi:hypothetical protein